MTKKEATIKYISEMNSDMLSLILNDDKSYMDVSKELFIEKIAIEFERLKNQEINEFSKVIKGHCGGNCNNGCGGYRFLTKDNQALDLILEEDNKEINDIYTCNKFIPEEKNEIVNDISWRFHDDEKSDYIPTRRHQFLLNEIETAWSEFDQFKNNITDIEDFCDWSSRIDKLYENINIAERFNLKFTNELLKLTLNNNYIQDLILHYPWAHKAMNQYNNLKSSNEKELIEWVLKYHDNELSFGDYELVENWKKNNLILHGLDKSVVIDCSKYADALKFAQIHTKHYWELFEKYKITDEQFKKEKANNKGLQYNLKTFLKIRDIYQKVILMKMEDKPLFTEYIIGEPDATIQFIEPAAKELGINIKVKFHGCIVDGFLDNKGEWQIKPIPEKIKSELENKKANKFYIKEIGLDWKSKLQSKKMELFNNRPVDDLPF